MALNLNELPSRGDDWGKSHECRRPKSIRIYVRVQTKRVEATALLARSLVLPLELFTSLMMDPGETVVVSEDNCYELVGKKIKVLAVRDETETKVPDPEVPARDETQGQEAEETEMRRDTSALKVVEKGPKLREVEEEKRLEHVEKKENLAKLNPRDENGNSLGNVSGDDSLDCFELKWGKSEGQESRHVAGTIKQKQQRVPNEEHETEEKWIGSHKANEDTAEVAVERDDAVGDDSRARHGSNEEDETADRKGGVDETVTKPLIEGEGAESSVQEGEKDKTRATEQSSKEISEDEEKHKKKPKWEADESVLDTGTDQGTDLDDKKSKDNIPVCDAATTGFCKVNETSSSSAYLAKAEEPRANGEQSKEEEETKAKKIPRAGGESTRKPSKKLSNKDGRKKGAGKTNVVAKVGGADPVKEGRGNLDSTKVAEAEEVSEQVPAPATLESSPRALEGKPELHQDDDEEEKKIDIGQLVETIASTLDCLDKETRKSQQVTGRAEPEEEEHLVHETKKEIDPEVLRSIKRVLEEASSMGGGRRPEQLMASSFVIHADVMNEGRYCNIARIMAKAAKFNSSHHLY